MAHRTHGPLDSFMLIVNNNSCRARELSEDETIYISYTSLHHPTAKRRAALREQYYFECGCSRCCDCEGDQLQNGERDDDALEAAFDLALEEERFEAAYDIGADILAAYEKFAPQFDPNTGVMLLKMGKLALYLVNFIIISLLASSFNGTQSHER